MTISQENLAAVKTRMDARYENKQANKKTTISGSYTGDDDSYPTVLACLNKFGEIVTSWSLEPSDSKYPSEKLVKDTFDTKISKSQTVGLVKNDGTIDTTQYVSVAQGAGSASKTVVTDALGNITVEAKPVMPTATSDLTNDGDGTNPFLTQHQSLTSTAIDVVKQQTPDSGYAASYYITQGGQQVGVKINVMKDKMLRSVSYETVGATPTSDETASQLTTGDHYLKFVVNTTDNDGTTTLLLPTDDIFVLPTPDNVTLEENNNVWSIKNGGVSTAKIADGAVTSAKIDSTVRSSWLTQADVDARINQALVDFAALFESS